MGKKSAKLVKIIFLLILGLILGPFYSDAKENYPTSPIQVIVPYPPGGGTDLVARIFAPKLETVLGEKVLIINKTGGGGTTGTAWGSQQKPDGYTLTMLGFGTLTSRTVIEKLPYSYKDFEYISQLCFLESMMAVQANAPWKTIEAFFEDAKKNPGKYSYSTSGPGSNGHVLMEALKDVLKSKIEINHVPFKGDGPACTALLGGHVDLCAGAGAFQPFLKAKTIRRLFTGIASKYKTEPSVKNFEELGHNITLNVWFGLGAPKGTPKEILKKLEAACKEACNDESFKEMIRNNGGIPDYMDGAEFARKIEKDYMLVKTMLDKLGLSAK